MKQEPAVKPIEVPNINLPTTNPGPGRRVKPSLDLKLNNETKSQKKSDKCAMPTRKRTSQLEVHITCVNALKVPAQKVCHLTCVTCSTRH